MKTVIRTILLLLIINSLSFASEYAIISNIKMKELSEAQIKAIYLKKITVVNDISVVPVNLGAMDSLRLKFENKILDMSFERLKSYWTKEHYLGKRPPLSMQSAQSVKAFVKNVEGAVGYVNAEIVDSDVKVLYRWSE
ncbi:MAG: hypothetical protein PHI38_06210 [Sulfurimonas sp.]|uniref:hypothetical protein n=1 Tax=Sulfurimonas sp. TaxID=2022749 RepID=UPI002620BFFC|nr:hypothetical protein [Sulfurimonas sp.]MDD3476443.1 hypothetical protein [Sulfurimonas sp.]